MWRSVRLGYGSDGKLVSYCRRRQSIQRCLHKSFLKLYSTSPTSSSANAGRIILGIAGTSIVIGGGTVLAAKLNQGFRSYLEDNVPYSDRVFSFILGEADVPVRPVLPPKKEQEFPFRSTRLPSESPIINKKVAPLVPAPVIDPPKSSASVVEGKEVVSSDKSQNEASGKVVDKDTKSISTSEELAAENVHNSRTSSGSEKSDLQKEKSADQSTDVSLAKKLKNQIENEIKRQEQEIDDLYKEKADTFPREYKEELLKHLRRQAVFHSEYLRALLQAQKNELKSEFEDAFQDKVSEAKHKLQEELASSLAQLTAIRDELNAYIDSHNKWSAAKKLWVACWALKQSCDPRKQEGVSYDDQRKPLFAEVEFLSAAGGDDKFIHTIVQAIPADAVQSGVYSKEILIERFFKLDCICRKVAVIGDSGGNLFRYATSYLQSLLIKSNTRLPASLEADEPVDVSKIDVYSALDNARWYILQGNLETAVRYVNLLKGTPRKVASDWLKDARTYLEVNQAVDVLIARSGATDVLTL